MTLGVGSGWWLFAGDLGLTAQPAAAAGAALQEFFPRNCSFLNGPWLNLALSLMGNVALHSCFFPTFFKV